MEPGIRITPREKSHYVYRLRLLLIKVNEEKRISDLTVGGVTL